MYCAKIVMMIQCVDFTCCSKCKEILSYTHTYTVCVYVCVHVCVRVHMCAHECTQVPQCECGVSNYVGCSDLHPHSLGPTLMWSPTEPLAKEL